MRRSLCAGDGPRLNRSASSRFDRPLMHCSNITTATIIDQYRPVAHVIMQVGGQLIGEQREALPVQDPIDRARRDPPRAISCSGAEQLRLLIAE